MLELLGVQREFPVIWLESHSTLLIDVQKLNIMWRSVIPNDFIERKENIEYVFRDRYNFFFWLVRYLLYLENEKREFSGEISQTLQLYTGYIFASNDNDNT